MKYNFETESVNTPVYLGSINFNDCTILFSQIFSISLSESRQIVFNNLVFNDGIVDYKSFADLCNAFYNDRIQKAFDTPN